MILYLETDELRELWNLIRDNKEKVVEYGQAFGLTFAELRGLMSACEKIERAYNEEVEKGEL